MEVGGFFVRNQINTNTHAHTQYFSLCQQCAPPHLSVCPQKYAFFYYLNSPFTMHKLKRHNTI